LDPFLSKVAIFVLIDQGRWSHPSALPLSVPPGAWRGSLPEMNRDSAPAYKRRTGHDLTAMARNEEVVRLGSPAVVTR